MAGSVSRGSATPWGRRGSLLLLALALGCAGEARRPVLASQVAAARSALPQTRTASPADARETEAACDLSRHFGSNRGTFVVFDAARQRWTRHDRSRAMQGFLPGSTFKVVNALIALESGIAEGPEFLIPYNPARAPAASFWPASWARDHTLHSALRASAVWYFQELARRIGRARMAQSLAELDYGNESVEGELDSFWLDGGLRVSADQQVGFLRRLWSEALPVSSHAQRTLKSMLVIDEQVGSRISGKTGTVRMGETRQLSWLVGYVEAGARLRFFAWNFEGPSDEFWDQQRRVRWTMGVLNELSAQAADAG